jgi:hypothetical protein
LFSNPFFMRFYFILFQFLIIALPFRSQTTFGIKTGLNLSKAVYMEKEYDAIIKPYRKIKPGFTAGIYLNQKLNPSLSVEVDLLYSQKGLKFVQEPFHKTVNTMNYIELPVSGQFMISGNKTSSLVTEIGGFISWWTDGKYIETDFASNNTSAQKVDFKSDYYKYSRIDAGVLAGLIYNLRKMAFSLRYTHSMMGSSRSNADALSNKVITTGLIIKL